MKFTEFTEMSGPSSLPELYSGPRTRSRSRSGSKTSVVDQASDSYISDISSFQIGIVNEFGAIFRIVKTTLFQALRKESRLKQEGKRGAGPSVLSRKHPSLSLSQGQPAFRDKVCLRIRG